MAEISQITNDLGYLGVDMDEGQFDRLIKAIDAPKWTEIATFILLLVSIFVALLSAYYAIKQLKSDHARSKRSLSVDLCTKWSDFLTFEIRSAVSIIENFNSEQVQAITQFDTIVFKGRYKKDVIDVFIKDFPDIEKQINWSNPSGDFEIDRRYVKYLHYTGLKYCNILESILLAWSAGIADHDLLVKEFRYIFDNRENRTALAEFRKKVGEEYYPAINEFYFFLDKEKRKASNTHKEPVG